MIRFRCPKCSSELVIEKASDIVVTRRGAKGEEVEWTFEIPQHVKGHDGTFFGGYDCKEIGMWRHPDQKITYAMGRIAKVCRMSGAQVSVDKLPDFS